MIRNRNSFTSHHHHKLQKDIFVIFHLSQEHLIILLISFSCLTSLSVLINDTMNALLAQAWIIMHMLGRELSVLPKNQLN